MRDVKISGQLLAAHMEKLNITCNCGAGPDELAIESDPQPEICTPLFIHASSDGMRTVDESYCGPFAMVHCRRCGRAHLFFIPEVIKAIVMG